MVDGNVRILIVDDDPTIRSVLEALLDDEGFIPITAVNGRDAIEHVHADLPRLVLMDLMMPIMTGVEAIRQLKTDPATAHIPIIAMSAGIILRESVNNLLADSIVSKPFDLDALVAAIHTAVRRTGQTGELSDDPDSAGS